MSSEPRTERAADTVTFELDGRQVTVPKGTVLVDAARTVGIEIPIFCYEPRLGSPIGACRMCLVEVEGMRGLQTGCSTVATPDMVVRTASPIAAEAQEGVLEFLLENHPLDCPVCDKGGECPLQERSFHFGSGRSRLVEPKRHFAKPLDLSPLVAIDRERCIQCYRCVRFSQDVAEDGQLTFQERGDRMEVATFSGEAYEGRFTGNIVDLCPVGALTSIPYRFVARPWDIQNAPSVCAGCPVGCNVELTTREGEVRRVTGRPEPNRAVEEGWLCDRGRWAFDADRAPDRLREPILRDAAGVRTVPLDRAVGAVAGLLLRPGVRTAILVGPESTVEEGSLALRLAGVLGSWVARLGIPAEPLAALRALPGAQLGDLDRADLVAVVGGAPSEQQPVVELRVRKARRHGARVVTAGPRPHALEALGEALRTEPLGLAAAIDDLASRIAGATRPVVLWDEADLAAEPPAAAALARAIAASPAACQLELGQDVNGAGLRAVGLGTAGVLEALEAGEVDVLVTVHADPLGGPGGGRWARAAGRARTVVEIGTHRTALTARAAVVLPALTALEREGELVSRNGRAQRLRPGARGPEGAAAAWEILVALSHRLGRPFPERTPTQVFAAAAASCAPFAGLTHSSLGTEGAPIDGAAAAGPAGAGEPRTPAGEGLALVATTPTLGGPGSRSAALAPVRPAAALTLHPAAAEALGLAEGAAVRVASPEGACVLPLRLDERCSPAGAYVPLGLGAGTEALLPADRGPVRVALTAEGAA